MAYVIALVAEKGAGKGLFVKLAEKLYPELKVFSVRFSDPLVDILNILDKEISRENLITLATALRGAFQDEGIINAALKKRIKNTAADIIILDGLRKAEEVKLVKELDGNLIYIKADAKIRFERRRLDAEKTDEQDVTWEQFQKQDNAPTEFTIREVGENLADIKIENNGTVEELEEVVKPILNKLIHGT